MRQATCLILFLGLASSQACAGDANSAFAWTRAPLQGNVSFTLDNNVTRALFAADRLSDHVLAVELSDSMVVAEFERSRIVLQAGVDLQRYRRYGQLNQLRASVEAAYQYRASPDFDAATLTLLARASRLASRSALREGHALEGEASVRRFLTDRIAVFGALNWQQRSAGSAVFSGHARSLRSNLDYSLPRGNTLYFGAEWRRGDLASTGKPALETLDIASVLVRDTAFPDPQLNAYRFVADTALASAGLNMALGRGGALDFSWRRAVSQARDKPSFLERASRYGVSTYSLAYLVQF